MFDSVAILLKTFTFIENENDQMYIFVLLINI